MKAPGTAYYAILSLNDSHSSNKKRSKDMHNHSNEKQTIILRDATLNDLSVLQHWDEQPHNIDADPESDWNWQIELTRQPLWREQLIAELDGRPIGFIQIIDPYEEETHYWGPVDKNLRAIDIWIGEKDDLRKGYGTTMMKLALKRCFDNQHTTAVLIDPLVTNLRAHKFYEYMGFTFVEKTTLGEDDCLIYKLTRTQWEESTI